MFIIFYMKTYTNLFLIEYNVSRGKNIVDDINNNFNTYRNRHMFKKLLF